MDFKAQSHFYNLSNPDEPLQVDDARNVDFDGRGDPTTAVRGVNWSATLARLVRLAHLGDRRVCEFFTGLRGSGKSTELLRLATRLMSGQDGVKLLPVRVDAELALDITSPIDVPDILFAILARTDERLLEIEARPGAPVMHEGFVTRFVKYLAGTDLDVSKIEAEAKAEAAVPGAAKVSAGGKVVAELKTRPSLRNRVRQFIAQQLTTFLADVHAELRAMDARAKALGFDGLVIIVDQLEKLRGLSTNWSSVLGSAEQVFANGAPYLRLPVHVIYTVPPALVLRITDPPVKFMPMLKLHDRQGGRFEPGFEAARAMVHARVPAPKLAEVLGPAAEARLDTLIASSGGYPREIVRLLQIVVGAETLPLSDQVFQRTLNIEGDTFRHLVPENAFEWLATIAVERTLRLKDDAHREVADQMLSNNIVLRYLNDSEWFDLHPAVRTIPGMSEAIARVRAKLASPG